MSFIPWQTGRKFSVSLTIPKRLVLQIINFLQWVHCVIIVFVDMVLQNQTGLRHRNKGIFKLHVFLTVSVSALMMYSVVASYNIPTGISYFRFTHITAFIRMQDKVSPYIWCLNVWDHLKFAYQALKWTVPTRSPWTSGVPRGGGLGCSNPPRNSEDIGGVLDHIIKKNRRLDFHL